MNEPEWVSIRVKLDLEAIELLGDDKRAVIEYPVTGAVRFIQLDEDSGLPHVALVTQPKAVVTLIKLLQKEDETDQKFEDRISLYLMSMMHMITPEVKRPQRFNLMQTGRFKQKGTERLGIYVQILCDSEQ